MNSWQPVVLRVELDHMKQQLRAAIMEREVGISKLLSDELDRVLTPENIERIVREQADIVLRQSVQEALRTATQRAFHGEEVSQMIDDMALQAVVKWLQKRAELGL